LPKVIEVLLPPLPYLAGPHPSWVMAAAAVAGILASARVLTGARLMRDVHRRGAIVRTPQRMSRAVRRRRRVREGASVHLGGVTLRPEDETRHFKLLGTTGTGKSTAIRELLGSALARGDRAVITDPDGAYLKRFYDRYRGDVILNPFEPHSVRWDPFAEARSPFDYEELARSLIPEAEDATGREWRGYARTFVSAVLRGCSRAGPRDVATLWQLLAVAPVEDLRSIVAGTPAQPFLHPENARMFSSIRSVAVSEVAALEYVQWQRAAGFSVRDWVAAGQGVLFTPYRAGQISALRSIIATWMRLAIFEALQRPDHERQPLWYVIDELDALGKIDGLQDALARLRQFGGRCVLGLQSIAQATGTYGAREAQTIIENCGNTLILRCSASEHGGTSQFASRLIGEREIIRRQTSRARDRGGLLSARGLRRSTHVSELHATEVAVMPSEIEQLPDLTGYLKTASSPHWMLVRLAPDTPWRSTTSA
jgi:type IV secretory pathway TraG/TraD family ATPase VirD4